MQPQQFPSHGQKCLYRGDYVHYIGRGIRLANFAVPLIWVEDKLGNAHQIPLGLIDWVKDHAA